VLQEVVELISLDVAPVLSRAALSGHAVFSTHSPLLADPMAREMLADILSDRGFGVEYELRRVRVPVYLSAQTGELKHVTEEEHCVHITCERALLRTAHFRGSSASTLLSLPSFEPQMPSASLISNTHAPVDNNDMSPVSFTAPAAAIPSATPARNLHESEVSEVVGG
jgi:hypothetical protein